MLSQQREEAGRFLATPTMAASTPARTRSWRRWLEWSCDLTKTQTAQLGGGEGRGEHGEAIDELADTFLQRRGS